MTMAVHESAKTLTQTKLFIGALILGAASILAGKLVPGGYAFLLLAILVPIVVMIAYAFFNHRVGFLDSTRAQVADNSYFLGFLFFLVSLAITLAQVSAGEERRIEVEPIIRGFGIALATTIVGLFLRIILLQNIAGLTSAREKAEESLLNAVSRFEKHIEVSLDLFAKAREGVLATNASTTDAVKRTLVELAESTRQATDAATKGYVDGLLGATKATTDELAAALASFKTKIVEMKLPSDALTAVIEPHLAALQKVLAEVNQRTAEVRAGIGSSAAQIKKIEPGLTKLHGTLVGHVEGIEKVLGRLTASESTIQGFDERVQGLARALEQLTLTMTQASQGLKDVPQASVRAREVLADTEKATQGLKNALSATVASATSDARTLGKAVDELRTTAQQLVNSTQAAMVAIQGEIQVLGAAISKVREDMGQTESSSATRPWWRVGS